MQWFGMDYAGKHFSCSLSLYLLDLVKTLFLSLYDAEYRFIDSSYFDLNPGILKLC